MWTQTAVKSSHELGTAVFDQLREQEQRDSGSATPDEDASLLLVLAASAETEGDLESVYARLEQLRLCGDATDDMAHRVLSRLIERAFVCVARWTTPAGGTIYGYTVTRAGDAPVTRLACSLSETELASRLATELARSGARRTRGHHARTRCMLY